MAITTPITFDFSESIDISTPGQLDGPGRASDYQIISAGSGYTGVSFVCHPNAEKQSVIGLQYSDMTSGQPWATMDFGVHCNWGTNYGAVLEYTLQASGAWTNDLTLTDKDSNNNLIFTPNEVWQVRLKDATTVEYIVGDRVVHTSTKPVTGDLHIVAHQYHGGTLTTDVKYVQQSLTGGGGTATAFGDPHVQNMMGTKFEIRRRGRHLMVALPRGSEASDSLLRVEATVQPAAEECGAMYIKSVTIAGQWLGSVPPMTFSARATAAPGALSGNELQVGDEVGLTPEDFSSRVPSSMVALTLPSKPVVLPDHVNKHASSLAAHMNFGPGIITKLSWVAERTPTVGVVNSLWISITHLAKANMSVGGLMGMDDFLLASKPSPECELMPWRPSKSAKVIAGADKGGQQWLPADAV